MPRIKQNYGIYALNDAGSHIKGRIRSKGLTQADIAKELDVTQQTVSRWLNNPGCMTIEQFQKIAKIVPMDSEVIIKAFFPWGTSN